MRAIAFGTPGWRRYVAGLPRAGAPRPAVARAVAAIVKAVERDGDSALLRLTARLDGVRLRAGDLHVPAEEVGALARTADPAVADALRRAAARIEAYHRCQRDDGFTVHLPGGSTLEERVRPLDAVGLYVPGGAAAYPSSVLMNAIPARVAGVPRIVVVTPPARLRENPAVAAALEVVGLAGSVYRVGGAQAVAALALGTATIPRVQKVVGPGNAFVAEAKRQLRGRVEIDREAGPSEVVILADGSASARLVAADLLAQAEHGSGDEVVVVVSPDRALLAAVAREVDAGVAGVANAAAARRALRRHGALVHVRDLAEGIEAVNAVAPEHAQVMCRGAARIARSLVAGAVFVGPHAPTAVGDYGIGPNHVLPTGGGARHASPLSVRDFVRRQSVVTLTKGDLARVAKDVVAIATAEGLVGHARSITARGVR